MADTAKEKMSEVEDLTANVEDQLDQVTIDEEKKTDSSSKNSPTEKNEEKDRDLGTVLKERNDNEQSQDPACAHCGIKNPTKRCSKRHPKCMKKMFCNESCEGYAHKKKTEDKKVVASAKTTEKTKKKGKSKKEKPSNEFWWNNSVYASW
eukprot:TRINITY_DN14652_c0_g1_i2.p1 TRINITY_DN14652_c0_g1~~TRINITY_DN14652_c0_g1_i2.p1  ORF type:complete len:150 (-),score=37.68 TRINITY_DN14652_c0_g1_i2:286-735(-)